VLYANLREKELIETAKLSLAPTIDKFNEGRWLESPKILDSKNLADTWTETRNDEEKRPKEEIRHVRALQSINSVGRADDRNNEAESFVHDHRRYFFHSFVF